MENYSPMINQYLQIKQENPGCVLFFRLGDFYEMFFEDAENISRELSLVLTAKDCGNGERAPMCGIPYHAVDGYIAKLIAKGYRIAVCEQLEDPATVKGLVKRGIIRIITPGTVTESSSLADNDNNFICSLYCENGAYGAAFADISTGEINALELFGDGCEERLLSEAAAYTPAELIYTKEQALFAKQFAQRFSTLLTEVVSEDFEKSNVKSALSACFGADWQPDISEDSCACLAVGALIIHLRRTQKLDMSYLRKPRFYSPDSFLNIDSFSRRNLELCKTMRGGERKGSLLWAIDRTVTSAGARLLKSRLLKPLVNCAVIKQRQQAVKELFDDGVSREELRGMLKDTIDLERLVTRLVYGTANARDLKALERTISLIPKLKDGIAPFKSRALCDISERLDTLDEIGESIAKTISDEPPMTLREGGLIRAGCNAAVDELSAMMNDGKKWITKIEETERERTGIRTLRIGYNRVFGYYIEVSKSFINQVPQTYIRRQTLANGERYVTEELKDMESRVTGAKDKLFALEYELFSALRDYVLKAVPRIQQTAFAIAELDFYCSNAVIASEYSLTCPEVDYSDKIVLKDSRHPVVERFCENSRFVPNDCLLDCKQNRLMLITGPNMAGKSTYMRQVALSVILAQTGAFVPAAEARIGIADRIFTRIGASDDLATGNSTFMLEMTEVAEILRNATQKSLIIYDEIGRGTSTYDGMSIARAVIEYTAQSIGARTLFATHYHELTALEGELDGVVNYNIAAKKRGNDIIFLRKILRGCADDSYGIEVAALAGVPDKVVKRAKQILTAINEGEKPQRRAPANEENNVTFEDISESCLREKLKDTDINTLTPYEALTLLYELKKLSE